MLYALQGRPAEGSHTSRRRALCPQQRIINIWGFNVCMYVYIYIYIYIYIYTYIHTYIQLHHLYLNNNIQFRPSGKISVKQRLVPATVPCALVP